MDARDEWEQLLEYGRNAEAKDYQAKLEQFIAKCIEPYNPFKMNFTDAFCDEQSTGAAFAFHYKPGILAAIEVKNINFLEFYLDFLERDLELCEIKMGFRFEEQCTADDLSELEDYQSELYYELKPLYLEVKEFINCL